MYIKTHTLGHSSAESNEKRDNGSIPQMFTSISMKKNIEVWFFKFDYINIEFTI